MAFPFPQGATTPVVANSSLSWLGEGVFVGTFNTWQFANVVNLDGVGAFKNQVCQSSIR
jgi:hypothetical protein